MHNLSPKRQRILTEVLWVYTGTIGIIFVLYQMRGISTINSHLWTLAMLLQVYVPSWMAQRQEQTLVVYGMHLSGWKKSLYYGLLTTLIFIIPTLLGHHIWQQYHGYHLRQNTVALRQYRHLMRGTPQSIQKPQQIQIFTDPQGQLLTVRWQAPVHATLSTDGSLSVVAGHSWLQGPSKGKVVQLSGGGFSQVSTVRLRVSGSVLKYIFRRDGQLVPTRHIRLGPQLQPASSYSLPLNFEWLVYLIIAQCLMVALPEELFYRGYMQTRLDSVFPVRTFWGIPMSWGNVLVSALFALTHFLIGFDPSRLSVFFPSLVFGALKHRTQSLLAPILFHAMANILVKMLETFYR